MAKILDEAAADGSLDTPGQLLVEAGDEIVQLRMKNRKLKSENAKLRLENQELRTLRDQQGSVVPAEVAEASAMSALRSSIKELVAPCGFVKDAVPLSELRRLVAWRCGTTEQIALVAMRAVFGKCVANDRNMIAFFEFKILGRGRTGQSEDDGQGSDGASNG